MKKTPSKKLLLKNEKVRELSPQKLEQTAGGGMVDYSIAGQSYGGTQPAPTKDTQVQMNFNYYYFGG